MLNYKKRHNLILARFLYINFLAILNRCNTDFVTGKKKKYFILTVEGVSFSLLPVYIKILKHYTIILLDVFTNVQCGDLDLD